MAEDAFVSTEDEATDDDLANAASCLSYCKTSYETDGNDVKNWICIADAVVDDDGLLESCAFFGI
jgi:hypothetical protein